MESATINAVMEKGYRSLVESLGSVDTEIFVSAIKNDNFDYSHWRDEYFGRKTPEEIKKELYAFDQKNS